MADFTGFYFDHIHSSTYNIYRVSNGSRFEEGLLPEFEDFSISVVGGNGDLYQGRRFKPITFKINIAYDNLTELKLRQLRNWLSGEELKPLQFDERPYKTYFAKISSRPIFNYICFLEEDEGDELYSGGPTEFTPMYDGFVYKSSREPMNGPTIDSPRSENNKKRIYKGEGEITFTAYDPFGYCENETYEIDIKKGLSYTGKINWQLLTSYTPFKDLNGYITEWGAQSGLLSKIDYENGQFNTLIEGEAEGDYSTFYIPLYNPGDRETDYQLYIDLRKGIEQFAATDKIILSLEKQKYITDYNQDASIPEPYLQWTEIENSKFVFTLNGLYGYNHILLKSKQHSLLVYPSAAGRELPDSRYDLVTTTHWPKIPLGVSRLKILIPTSCIGEKRKIQIKYDYIYY